MSQSRKNAAFALLDRGSTMAFALGTVMLLLRGLSKEDFAAWGLFLLITYFTEMARSGLIQNGLVRHLSLHRRHPAEYAAIKRAALLLNLAFTLVTNLILWLCLDWIVDTWKTPQLYQVFPVYYLTNIVSAFLFQFNYVQQAHHAFKGIFQANFLVKGSLFSSVLLLWLLDYHFDLTLLALAMLAGTILGVVASYRALIRLDTPVCIGSPQSSDIVGWLVRLAGFGKWVLGTNLSTMFYKSIDKLALGHLAGLEAFAVYDAAGKVTQLVEAPSFSIAAVAFPQGAERMEKEGPAGIKYLYERSVGAILAIILPFLFVILLFSKPIMLAFAGPEYLESAGLLVITAFFGLFLPFAVQFGTILDATGKPQINFAFTAFTALLNLGLSWWFIHEFGWNGAAFATLSGYAISFVLMQVYLYKNFKINALNAFLHIPDLYRLIWDWMRSGTFTPDAREV